MSVVRINCLADGGVSSSMQLIALFNIFEMSFWLMSVTKL